MEDRNYSPDDSELQTEGTETLELENLMKRYQEADLVAADELVKALNPRLHRFFAQQTISSAEADDMVQEAWLRIHRIRHTYRPGSPLLPWIYAISRRVRIDNYRKRSRIGKREVSQFVDMPVAEAAAPAGVNQSFGEMVKSLPESQREVLTLLKVKGLSIAEVARATLSTEGAVKQKAHRAYERLRSLLGQRGGSAQ